MGWMPPKLVATLVCDVSKTDRIEVSRESDGSVCLHFVKREERVGSVFVAADELRAMLRWFEEQK